MSGKVKEEGRESKVQLIFRRKKSREEGEEGVKLSWVGLGWVGLSLITMKVKKRKEKKKR